MTKKQDAPCRVWWFEGFWEEDRCRAAVVPYGDYGEEPVRNLGNLSYEITGRKVVFTDEHGPDSLFINKPQKKYDRIFDDLGPMGMGAILVSGAMIDLLARFDLGETQVLELPMYYGVDRPQSEFIGMEQPDRFRPLPGRWGLLHVLAKKSSMIEEKCVGVDRREASWRDITLLSVPSRSKKTVLALDAEVACSGVDLWFDEQITRVPSSPTDCGLPSRRPDCACPR